MRFTKRQRNSSMNKERLLLKENKEILYKYHDYNPSDGTKNVHHIIEKSMGGSNQLENLSLIDRDLHQWIHWIVGAIKQNTRHP